MKSAGYHIVGLYGSYYSFKKNHTTKLCLSRGCESKNAIVWENQTETNNEV